jgi:hypothetical protein
MNEKEKYEKVWRECERYGKNWVDAGLGRPYKRPFLETAKPASTVIDFGCGNGSSLGWVKYAGFLPKGVEIAGNAVTQNHNLITIGDLRDAGSMIHLGVAQYGLCTDLMEHIPTDDVETVLFNLAAHVTEAVFFGIARLPDKDGDALGLELHLTIQDKEWWDEKILEHFSRCDVVRYDDGCYLLWAWK